MTTLARPAPPTTTDRTRTAGIAGGAVLAAAAAAIGVLQIIRPDDLTSIDGSMSVILTLFAVTLVAQIPPLRVLSQRAASVWPLRLAVAGGLLLAVAATSSNVNGEDLGWFPLVAAPANALWLGGLVALAVVLWRRRSVPRWLALGLPITWAGSIVLSQMGGGLLVAGYWAAATAHLAASREGTS